MCLSVIARVLKIMEDDEAIAELGGVRKQISLGLMADQILPGDWVLIHTGYAIAKVDEEKAKEMLEAISEMEEQS